MARTVAVVVSFCERVLPGTGCHDCWLQLAASIGAATGYPRRSMYARAGFRYGREPLCVLATLLYVANSIWWKPITADPTAFVHCYLGDVLCLPVCLPVTLWLQRCVGLRTGDWPPSGRELLLHWLLWSVCFEWLGPHLPLLAPGAVADPWDAVAYGVGGLVASSVWRSRGGGPRPEAVARMSAVVGKGLVAVVVALSVLSAYRFGVVFR